VTTEAQPVTTEPPGPDLEAFAVPEVPAWRLLTTLACAGMLAGLLLVFVHKATQPAILAHKAAVLRAGIHEVLADPERFETLYVTEAGLSAEPPPGASEKDAERVYLGIRPDGSRAGFAVETSKAGFQDQIVVLFGYDPGTGTVLGIKVLGHKETPGLGDKIERDGFTGQFTAAATPLEGVKAGKGGGEGQIEMITGATISSRTVIGAINKALERLGPRLAAYEEPVSE
jgi:electron transport complex protein RnfG